VTALAFAPDGSRLVSGSEAGVMMVWNPANGARLTATRAHTGAIAGVAVSPNGKGIATAGADNVVRVWNMQTFASIRSFRPPKIERGLVGSILNKAKPAANAVAFSANSRYVASAHADMSAIVWDIKTGYFKRLAGGIEEQGKGQAPGGPVLSVAMAPNGRLAAVGEQQDSHTDVLGKTSTWAFVYLFDPYKAKVLKKFDANHSVLFLAFLPDSEHVVTALSSGDIVIWDTAEGEPVKTLNHGDSLRTAALSQDGSRLASLSGDVVKVWDLATAGVQGFRGPLGSDFTAVAITGDGSQVAVGNSDAGIQLMPVGQMEAWEAGPEPVGPAAKQPPAAPPGKGPAKPLKPEDQIWDE
jgi:WD40 repeat protein